MNQHENALCYTHLTFLYAITLSFHIVLPCIITILLYKNIGTAPKKGKEDLKDITYRHFITF